MWQLGLRYDTIDLDDGAVVGGKMDIWTAGVNWYWRSNFKFMLNYVMVDQRATGRSERRSEHHRGARAVLLVSPVFDAKKSAAQAALFLLPRLLGRGDRMRTPRPHQPLARLA